MSEVIGHITQTTPPSSPLDTLKALALRSRDRLDWVIDQLAGGDYDVPDVLIEFIEGVQQMHLRALGEHIPVARDERLGELRWASPAASRYDDGSPVIERWEDEYGVSHFYPRYDGDRAARLLEHDAWVAENRSIVKTETAFRDLTAGLDLDERGDE